MRIDDNGIVRDMTPEEEAAYLTEMEANKVENTPSPDDYEAVKALLERYGVLDNETIMAAQEVEV